MRALLVVAIVVATGAPNARAIVGGAPSADPAVVALVRADGTALACSGVVIAPHAVLTAAHCLAGGAPDALVGGERRTPVATFVAPGFVPATLANDLAILVFDRALAVAPHALASEPPVPGATMELVGFGRTAPDDTAAFAQRAGSATVAESTSAGIVSRGPAFTCEGDSGGPALVGGAVAGVTSSGDVGCAEHSRHTRVADHLAFVADTVERTRPGSARAGDRCWYADHCGDGACLPALDEPRLSFCTPACTGGACPDDLACVDGLCRHAAPSPGALGARCTTADACVDGLCLAPAGASAVDDARCTARCFSDLVGFPCPEGTACEPASDGQEACFAPPADAGCCASAPPSPVSLALLVLAVLGQLLRGRGRP